jgi:hypothetical protein
MKEYEDRFLAESYAEDEPVSFGIVRPGAEPEWKIELSESLFTRAQLISDAYCLHVLPAIDHCDRTSLNPDQCETLASELRFVATVVNDDLLARQLSSLIELVEECVRKPGPLDLVIEGP